MEFRPFPYPTGDVCTPFVFLKDRNCFSRFYYDGTKYRTLTIESQKGSSCPTTNGVASDIVIGRRRPNRRKLLNYCSIKRISHKFAEYVGRYVVYPTFALSLEEALVRTVIRQLIRANHAKSLYSSFIKTFGYADNGLFGFPSLEKLKRISDNDLRNIGVGFKTRTIMNGIHLIADQRSSEVSKMSGIGPWSTAILNVELNRDYSHYPFWDMSVERIRNVVGLDLQRLSLKDRDLAADLYVYAASYLESIQ